MAKDLNYLSLFEELIIFKSFFTERIDKNIRKKEIKKYIKAGSVIDFSIDLSSNKLNTPKINERVKTLKKLIWIFGFLNKNMITNNRTLKISKKK